MKLSPTQIQELDNSGFLILREVFSKKEVGLLKNYFDRLYQISEQYSETCEVSETQFVYNDDGVLQRAVWVCGAIPEFSTLALDDRLLLPVTQLLKVNQVQQLICQAHFKKPGDGVDFPWHQDSQHRRYGTNLWNDVNGTGSYIQTVLAIDPMTSENGPLKVIAGSHKFGHLEMREKSEDDQENFWRNLEKKHEIIEVSLEAGDLVLFGPYLVHSSSPNISRQQRRVFINGFAVAGANKRVYPGAGEGKLIDFKSL